MINLRINKSFLVLLATMAIGTFISPYFWTTQNLLNIAEQATLPVVLAVGAAFVIASGEIDLSVGSIVALSTMCFGLSIYLVDSLSAVILTLLLGVGCGVCSGLLSIRIPSFVATLATMAIYRGGALLLTNGNSIAAPDDERLGVLGRLMFAPNVAITVAAVSAVMCYASFKWTAAGLAVLATGSNSSAARYAGINVGLVRSSTFALSGLCASAAGILLFMRLGAARPTAGIGYELDAIAAVVVGGASLRGGQVDVVGLVSAALLFATIKDILVLSNVSASWQLVVTGLLVTIAVLLQHARDDRGH